MNIILNYIFRILFQCLIWFRFITECFHVRDCLKCTAKIATNLIQWFQQIWNELACSGVNMCNIVFHYLKAQQLVKISRNINLDILRGKGLCSNQENVVWMARGTNVIVVQSLDGFTTKVEVAKLYVKIGFNFFTF